MPKRIVDGEALWTSDKLLRLPVKYRAEFANLIPLASASGSFEADGQKIWRAVYSYNRPDVTPQKVADILTALELAKMLFRWTDAEGKIWGYFPGIDKPGRLPARSQVERKNFTGGPFPPTERLNAFLQQNAEGLQVVESGCQVNDKSLPSQSVVIDKALPSQCQVNDKDRLGFGFGSGLGMAGHGSSVLKEQEPKTRTGEERPVAPLAFQGKKLRITVREDEELKQGFPWVDLQGEYRKADEWLFFHPDRHIKRHAQFMYEWVRKVPGPQKRKEPVLPRLG